MNHIVRTHYQPTDSLTQYGDGVFETMLGVDCEIHHWRYHWARLKSSCERLQISIPEHDALYSVIQTELRTANHEFSVIKMIVSRGEGLRGYRSHPIQPCFVQFNVTSFMPKQAIEGLNIRICQTRLSVQPLIAGMKHCNRLEYVMARRECDDSAFDEGLLLDYDNQLIEGLTTNVFLMNKTQIFTPLLQYAGVAGTMRAYLLECLPKNGFDVSESILTLDDVVQADAVFLTNATNGVMPVNTIQGIDKIFDTQMTAPIQRLAGHPYS